MTREEMKARTKQYTLRVIKAVQSLPNDRVANVLGSQFLRELLVESGTTTQQKLSALMKEGDEIVSIVVAALKTTRFGAGS